MVAALQTLETELQEACDVNFTSLIIPHLRRICNDFVWTYDAGLSKMVIIISGEDEVIKVPFHKVFLEDYYLEDARYADTSEEPLDENNYIYDLECADNEKLAEDLGLTFSGHDYCEVECAVYEAATNENLQHFFAREHLFAQAGSTNIYLQTRVEPYVDNARSDQDALSTYNRCLSLGARCFNAPWVADFFGLYGEKEFLRLDAFLKKYNLYDFHGGNLGYLNGLPILMDYSDYNEEW